MAARLVRVPERTWLAALAKRAESSQWLPETRRYFSSSARLREHRTYFQRGSQQPLPQFEGAPYGQDQGGESSSSGSGWKLAAVFIAGYLASALSSSIERVQGGKPQKASDARGARENAKTQPSLARESEEAEAEDEDDEDDEAGEDPATRILKLRNELLTEQLVHFDESATNDRRLREVQGYLDSANAAQLKAHNSFFEIITSIKDDKVILDEALIESRPIVLNDKTRVPASKAALIRILDQQGKNRMIIFGIDLDWHKDFKSLSAPFPSDSYDLDEWVCALTDEYNAAGEISEQGLTVYLYSNRVILDIDHETGFRWMTRYKPSDFPKGFPLVQMRKVKSVQDVKGSLENRPKVDSMRSAQPGKDKETP